MLEFSMRRIRIVFTFFLLCVLMACQSSSRSNSNTNPILTESSTSSITESKEFVVQEHFLITNHGPGTPTKHNLWVALIGDLAPYQEVLERSITPDEYRVFSDEYGNQIAEFDLVGLAPGESREVEIDYRVKVNRLAYDLSNCRGEPPTFFTQPELHIESNNPQIQALSEDLSRGGKSACDKVRAFYDYVGDHLVYTYNGRNWGAQAALGEMGADCSEYASLMIALSRAAGIPARYLEGVLYLDEPFDKMAKTEHAWLEVYLPGVGWTPMDPTLGRSPILRDDYFAAYTPDHIIVTRGRNPSALRGASYFSHIYWSGDSTVIKIDDFHWSLSLSE
jgi:transglutaminase-like putative cysteine protease